MPTSLVLTVLGEDRPGLVESLASIIAAHEGNWSESRMAQLAGQFAGILRASVPDAWLCRCAGDAQQRKLQGAIGEPDDEEMPRAEDHRFTSYCLGAAETTPKMNGRDDS